MKRFVKSALAVAVSLSFCVSAQGSDSDDSNLEKITVTGQKLEQSLQDTKESVAVFTSKILEDRNLVELTDVFQQTPGVTGDQFGFRIRGIRNSNGSSQPNRADLASIVLDGVIATGWIKSEGIGQLWDVSQVEILRGPQSTNLGRNSLAGAIVINTQNPVHQNEGKVRAGFGQYGFQEFRGVANVSLVEDVSAIRVSLETAQSDGFINNITRGEDDYGRDENSVYRLKWLYQPNDDLDIVLSYQHLENEYGNTSTILGNFDRDDRIALANEEALFETEADLVSLKVDYAINNEWAFTSITGFQDGERYRFNDADQLAVSVGSGGGFIRRNDEDNNWSQEFRASYETETVRGSSGVFISEIEARRSQDNITDLNLPNLFDNFSPGLGMVLTTTAVLPVALYQPFFDTRQTGFTNVDTSTWAVFTSWEFDFNDSWTLSLGARYDSEEQDFSTASNTTTDYVLPQVGGPFGAVDLGGLTIDAAISIINPQLMAFTAPVPQSQQTEDFNNFLPSAGVTYSWNDDVSTSFFVNKSYRSGGSELTLFNGVNNFDAEELWNYEAALRAVVLDGDGVFNANVYYGDWTDQQVGVPEPGTTNDAFLITVNAGESEIYGAEFSFNYYMSDNLALYVNGALTRTEYKDFASAQCANGDCAGNNFLFAPEETASVGFDYAHPNGLFVSAAANYVGSSYSDIANTREMSAFTLVNVNAGYEMDNLKFEAYVRNLTDKTYDINNNIAATDGTPGTRLGAPREVGARVTYLF